MVVVLRLRGSYSLMSDRFDFLINLFRCVFYCRQVLWSDKTIIHVLPSGAMTTNWGRVQLSMTGIVWCRCERIFGGEKFIICRAWSVKTLLVYSEFSSKACGRTRNLINTDLLNVPSQGFSILFFFTTFKLFQQQLSLSLHEAMCTYT